MNVGEIGKWSGNKKGLTYAMDKFHEKEKFKLLDTTRNMSANIQQLCQDLNNLCMWCDQIYNEMAHMHISVDEFKRFDTYYYKACDVKPVHKKEHKKKQDKGKKSKKSAKSCRKFPDDLWLKLMFDVISEMDKKGEVSELPKQQEMEEFTRPRPGGCRIKNASQPQFLALPSACDSDNILEQSANPIQSNPSEPGIVDQCPIFPEAEFVVTEEPKKSECKQTREDHTEDDSKKQ